MTRLFNIIFTFLVISGCSQRFNSTELNDNFSETEIKDLQKLTDFFQEQMCDSQSDFKSCMDSLIPDLRELGWQPIIEDVDFSEQLNTYKSLESNVFNEIWNICKSRNPQESWELKSVCLNTEGKYVRFLKDLSQKNAELKEYYKSMIATGDWESMDLLHRRIFTNSENYDLNDHGIQVLLLFTT